MIPKWALVLIVGIAGVAGLTWYNSRPKQQPQAVLVKRWSVDDPVFNGESFDYAVLDTMQICEIFAKHLNLAKESGRYIEDFGSGNYRYACEAER